MSPSREEEAPRLSPVLAITPAHHEAEFWRCVPTAWEQFGLALTVISLAAGVFCATDPYWRSINSICAAPPVLLLLWLRIRSGIGRAASPPAIIAERHALRPSARAARPQPQPHPQPLTLPPPAAALAARKTPCSNTSRGFARSPSSYARHRQALLALQRALLLARRVVLARAYPAQLPPTPFARGSWSAFASLLVCPGLRAMLNSLHTPLCFRHPALLAALAFLAQQCCGHAGARTELLLRAGLGEKAQRVCQALQSTLFVHWGPGSAAGTAAMCAGPGVAVVAPFLEVLLELLAPLHIHYWAELAAKSAFIARGEAAAPMRAGAARPAGGPGSGLQPALLALLCAWVSSALAWGLLCTGLGLAMLMGAALRA
jgi:hypothetical protein